MFGRATIRLGIGPHSSFAIISWLQRSEILEIHGRLTAEVLWPVTLDVRPTPGTGESSWTPGGIGSLCVMLDPSRSLCISGELYKKIASLRYRGWACWFLNWSWEKRKALRLPYASTEICDPLLPVASKRKTARRWNRRWEINADRYCCRRITTWLLLPHRSDLKATAFACRLLRSVICTRNLVGK